MKRAVVLVSGGLDSATVLAIARAEGWECFALSVDYGQRHRAELTAAARIADGLGAQGHRVVKVDLAAFGGSALTDPSIAVPHAPSAGIPATYVPARNTILLALALAQAEVVEAEAIFIGANAVDYSGYPDCRPEFLDAFSAVARLATRRAVEGAPMAVLAPIVLLSKRQIIERAVSLGVDLAATVSCYEADAAGRACGACEACRIRRDGFRAAGIDDPTRYRPAAAEPMPENS